MRLPQRLTKTQSTLVVGSVLLAIAALVIWYIPALFPEQFQPDTSTGEITTNAARFEQLRIKIAFPIDTILEDPRWKKLRVFGKAVEPKPLGRPNPYAPLPSTGQPTSNLPEELQQSMRLRENQ